MIAIEAFIGMLALTLYGAVGDERLQRLVDDLASANSGEERDEAAYQLIAFDQSHPECNLNQHHDTSVALTCECDRVLRRWAESDCAQINRADDLRHFESLIRDRLEVEIPKEWLSTILGASFSPDNVITMNASEYESTVAIRPWGSSLPIVNAKFNENGVLSSMEVSGAERSMGMNRAFAVPSELTEELSQRFIYAPGHPVSLMCTPESTLICLPSGTLLSWKCELLSYSVQSENPLARRWSKALTVPWRIARGPIHFESDGRGRLGTGNAPLATQLRANRKSVVVFLCTRHYFCLEERDLETGKLRTSFSNVVPRACY